MAINALNSAATGLRALSDRIDVIANNLANAENPGFQAPAGQLRRSDVPELQTAGNHRFGRGYEPPPGINVGLGTKISNTALDMTQGSLESTGVNTDVAIQGNGFFKIKILPNVGDGTGYTRNGSFFTNKNGDLVVGIGDGYELVPPITIPPGATDISVAQDGTVQYTPKGGNTTATAGQIQLSQFVNQQGLKLQGGSIYTETPASGPPIIADPGTNGAGPAPAGISRRKQRRPR